MKKADELRICSGCEKYARCKRPLRNVVKGALFCPAWKDAAPFPVPEEKPDCELLDLYIGNQKIGF